MTPRIIRRIPTVIGIPSGTGPAPAGHLAEGEDHFFCSDCVKSTIQDIVSDATGDFTITYKKFCHHHVIQYIDVHLADFLCNEPFNDMPVLNIDPPGPGLPEPYCTQPRAIVIHDKFDAHF